MKYVFIWESFGPTHADRCQAVARGGPNRQVIGIEIFSRSSTYEWIPETRSEFSKVTLITDQTDEQCSQMRRLYVLINACFKHLGGNFFFCNYENVSTLLIASILRLFRQNVYVMNDSKYDDYERYLSREIVKWFFYLPYQGALASGTRSSDYLRFLGIPARNISVNYNTVSVERLRETATTSEIYNTVNFNERYFIIICRLVEKKNLFVTLEAYSIYCHSTDKPRGLHIFGSGHLDTTLREHAKKLAIDEFVTWHGFVQTDDIARALNKALCLLLLSTEEQFGNVVLEACALGIPSIVSTAVGARDFLIRTGVSGFIVEPDNPSGAAYFMKLIGNNEQYWLEMRAEILKLENHIDSSCFQVAVDNITGESSLG